LAYPLKELLPILAVSVHASPFDLIGFVKAIPAAGYPPLKVISQDFIGDLLSPTDVAPIPPLGGIGVFTVDEQVSVLLYLLHSVFPPVIFANISSLLGMGFTLLGQSVATRRLV
jgi:hypothetical protein